VMCGGSILSCCPRNPHGHERALKEKEVPKIMIFWCAASTLQKIALFCCTVQYFSSLDLLDLITQTLQK